MTPDISEVAKNWATTLGIIIAGLWALWRWGYPRRADPRANAASLEGDLSVETNNLGTELLVVSVRALWINRGEFAVALDPTECLVSVYKLSDLHSPGPLDLARGLGSALFSQKPFINDRRLEVEPKTENKLRAHFVLQPGPVYLFRWEMKSLDADYRWRKEIVWKSP